MKLEKTKSYNTYMSNKKKTKPKSGVLRRKRDYIRYSELENEIHKYMRGVYNEEDYCQT